MKHQSVDKTVQAAKRGESRAAARERVPESPSASLMRLQRYLGNRALGRFLQAKLKVGVPGDRFEREADRAAEQVLAVPLQSAFTHAPLHIQRHVEQTTESANTAPASVDRVLASPGRPMESALQQDMEQRFGQDFSRVRVHSDGAAGQSARDVNAHAYTVGHDVVFGAGSYSPGTQEGRWLIAHELTHVVQQSGSDRIRAGHSNGKGGLLGRNVVFGQDSYEPETNDGKRILEHELAQVAQQNRGGTGTGFLAPENPLEGEAKNVADAAIRTDAPVAVAGQSAVTLARETEEDKRLRQKNDELWRHSGIVVPGLELPSSPPSPIDLKGKGIFVLDGPDNQLEVFVDDLHLATLRFLPQSNRDYAIASARNAGGKLAVEIRVASGTIVKDHNPLGDGPNRHVQLRVSRFSPWIAKGTPTSKATPAEQPVVKETPAPIPASPSSALPEKLEGDPYSDLLAEERATKVRDYLYWYTLNADQKILEVFRSCTPSDFQVLQDKLGDDMNRVIDKLDAFSAVELGSLGPVVYARDALNRKRAQYIVDTTLDFGAEPAQFFIFYLFSRMQTDDIKSVLRLLAADGDLKRTLLSMKEEKENSQTHNVFVMQKLLQYLTTRGVDLSEFHDRDWQWGDFGEGVGEFLSRDIWEKTVFADARYGRMNYQTRWLPPQLAERVLPAFYGQYYEKLNETDVAYGAVDYMTLGIPLGYFGAAKGAVQGAEHILIKRDPKQGVKELLPALIMLLSMLGGAKGKTATRPSSGEPVSGLPGPEGSGQFVLSGYEGPVSPAAARVGALLAQHPETQGAAGALLERLGPDGTVKAAEYVQNNSVAARFVVKGGLPALEALVEANGDVSAAEVALADRAAPAAPQLPPGPELDKPGSGYATAGGEVNESIRQRARYPEANMVPPKFPGADLFDFKGTSRRDFLTFEKVGGKLVTVVNTVVKGGHAISLKLVEKATVANIQARIAEALNKFANAFKKGAKVREPEPMVENIYWRLIMEGEPSRITIDLQLETAKLTPELVDAAVNATRDWEFLEHHQDVTVNIKDLPPLEVVITDSAGHLVIRSFGTLQKQMTHGQ